MTRKGEFQMKIEFQLENAVRKRYSVRNYSDRMIEPEKMTAIQAYIDSLNNPFGPKVNFLFLDRENSEENQKLGTYGVIKGARHFVGTTIKDEPMALEAIGYEMEVLMLYLASIGIGTCWLGGTFDRAGFADAMKVEAGEFFPAIAPYGYPAEKKHLKEIAMRKMIKADQRVEWSKLFLKDDFDTPLTQEEAGEYAFPLEMLRLGPSASNKQPWRVVLKNGSFHFYEYKEPGYSTVFPYDIQRLDMGIAAAHFELATMEKGLRGSIQIAADQDISLPNNMLYSFSWKIDI
jgi:nitroreductase